MENKVYSHIKKYDLLEKGSHLCLAVSGGADSVAMLFIFCALAKRMDLTLEVIHVEHGIRGEESLSDAAFVKGLCEKLNVKITIKSVDVPEYAKENGKTMEEAARILRYLAFGEVSAPIIATAHNSDDNAETFLFNLLRGSGLKGLSGIPLKRSLGDKTIIRPMLCASRSMIEDYLRERGQDFRTDSTNSDTRYTRNKIRKDLIPTLLQINEKAIEHINKTSEIVKGIRSYEEDNARRILGEALGDEGLSVSRIKGLPLELQTMVLQSWLDKETNGSINVTSTHLDAVLDLINTAGNKSWDIPGFRILRAYDNLCILGRDETKESIKTENVQIPLDSVRAGKTVSVLFSGEKISLRAFPQEKAMDIPEGSYTKWFDCDKIGNTLTLRFRGEGDYFTINPLPRKKSFSRFCIDEKIPKNDRDKVALLCEEDHILWALDYRISEYYKVSHSTKLILEVTRDYNGR